MPSKLKITRRLGSLLLDGRDWSFTLGTAGGRLVASRWENRLGGRCLDLGAGLELGVELDTADRRLWIEGWRGLASQVESSPPAREAGFGRGYWRAEFDDSAWSNFMMPGMIGYRKPHAWCWARTHLFLPDSCRGRNLTLVLGSLGLFDYRYTRVFINGRAVAARRIVPLWNEPGRFDIGPGAAIYKHLRFGQDNVIALQLGDLICRTRKLDAFDPRHAYHLPWPWVHPGQYEQYVAVGTPSIQANLRIQAVRTVRRGGKKILAVTLHDRQWGLEAQLVYHADEHDPVLHRSVRLTNTGTKPARVMEIRLGQYRIDAPVSEGYMGFPVYIDGQFFASLAHPAGWAIGQAGQVSLRQYAGKLLEGGQDLKCMESVLGVSPPKAAGQAFVRHVQRRMRRTVGGHDRPLAIFEAFGGWDLEQPDLALSVNLPESFCLDMARRLERFGRQTRQQFDVFSLEFWADPHGDLRRFHRANFPRGFAPLRWAMKRAGVAPGMWITSSTGGWNIGRNPVVAGTRAENPAYPSPVEAGSLCVATQPLRGLLADGLTHQITRNGARLIKIDGHHCVCYNTTHDHLPGLYSTQAIHDAHIEMLKRLDATCPDVFLMLYWGHSSPWWLLHADTLCEPGLHMEGASPSPWPTLYARDGVTISLDQAQEYCRDVPPLGKDSLGIWLSEWHWNSNIGSQRWAQGMVMDLCRGSLLLQPWTDRTWLNPPQRRQFARLLELLRGRPECFRNSRRILGSAWRREPYGYCCTDGHRAFLAIHNATWRDELVPLTLDSSWGLNNEVGCELYLHYPRRACLKASASPPKLLLRPFEVVLLEAVAPGKRPSGSGRFPVEAMPHTTCQPSFEVPLRIGKASAARRPPAAVSNASPSASQPLTARCLTGQLPAISGAGTLAVSVELARAGRVFAVTAVDCLWAEAKLARRKKEIEPVLTGKCYPAPWQLWRMSVEPSPKPVPFEMVVWSALPRDVELSFLAHFVPMDR